MLFPHGLMALEKSPLFTGLKRMGVEVEAVAAGHQMLNFSQDQSEKMMLKDALLKPHMSGDSLDHQMANLIAGVTGARDGIFESVLSYGKAVREQNILSYLRDKAVLYPDSRKRGRQTSEVDIKPQVQDIVAYLSSENKTHLGVITKILDKQVVELKIIKNGKSWLTNMHCSLIRLIYRADDPESFLNLCVTALRA